MSDKPNCPPVVYVCMSPQGRLQSTWSTTPPPEIREGVQRGWTEVVEYIPRRSIDRLLDAADDLVDAIAWFGRDAQVTIDAIKRVTDAIQEFRPDA